jgi:internalin A
MDDYFETTDFDRSIRTLYFNQDLSKGTAKDLAFFHNLTYLNGAAYTLSDPSLKFPYLKGLVASDGVSKLLTWLEPQQLLLLDITVNEKSIDGIEKFSNLKELKISADDVSNFTPVSGCRQLTKLTIDADDYIDKGIIDLNVISTLEQLEFLEIKSNKLKSAEFLKDLKKITHLSLEDTLILDLSCINTLDTLTYLSLIDNTTVKDYAFISGLVKLNTIKLSLSKKQSFPDASKLSEVMTLSVDSLDDVSVLKQFPKLINLTLRYANISNTSVFNRLKELEYLELKGAYGDFGNLNFLNQMPKLKTLDLSGMTFYTEIDQVFNIQTLESLNLNGCSMGLRFDRIKEQTKLTQLQMNKVKLYTNISVQHDGFITNVDYDDCNLEDNIQFLSKFQNLEYVSLQSNKLSNINFVEQLPNLKQLDIKDNYVTDIRPLSKLKDFKVLWCKGNSISQGLDLDSRFRVITE